MTWTETPRLRRLDGVTTVLAGRSFPADHRSLGGTVRPKKVLPHLEQIVIALVSRPGPLRGEPRP
ncbi:MAG TPA: hypothetical protein VLW50_08650 [Streptosporangiaceae bacterium]|nr:hypothetical protein [Streptosporangiaceae bacterium]